MIFNFLKKRGFSLYKKKKINSRNLKKKKKFQKKETTEIKKVYKTYYQGFQYHWETKSERKLRWERENLAGLKLKGATQEYFSKREKETFYYKFTEKLRDSFENFLEYIHFFVKFMWFLFKKNFWFIVLPIAFLKRVVFDTLFCIIFFFFCVLNDIFHLILRILFLRRIYGRLMNLFWFQKIKFVGNKTLTLRQMKYIIGKLLFGEDYEVPELDISHEKRILNAINRAIDSKTYKKSEEDLIPLDKLAKLEELIGNRHYLDYDIAEGRKIDEFTDFYIDLEDLRNLNFEEKILENVDYDLLLHLNEHILRSVRETLNYDLFESNDKLTKEHFINELKTKKSLYKWCDKQIRYKINIFIYMKKYDEDAKADISYLRNKASEYALKKKHMKFAKFLVILASNLDTFRKKFQKSVIEDELYEDSQEREESIEEVVNYDLFGLFSLDELRDIYKGLVNMKGGFFVKYSKINFMFLYYITGLAHAYYFVWGRIHQYFLNMHIFDNTPSYDPRGIPPWFLERWEYDLPRKHRYHYSYEGLEIDLIYEFRFMAFSLNYEPNKFDPFIVSYYSFENRIDGWEFINIVYNVFDLFYY